MSTWPITPFYEPGKGHLQGVLQPYIETYDYHGYEPLTNPGMIYHVTPPYSGRPERPPRQSHILEEVEDLGASSPWRAKHRSKNPAMDRFRRDVFIVCEVEPLANGILLGCPKLVYHLLINGTYWVYNLLILTFDPNFQGDILVLGGWTNPFETYAPVIGSFSQGSNSLSSFWNS